MVKGVSQKVIEVVRTDNKYFEKAILFLRPAAQDEDKTMLKNQAGEYLAQLDYRPARSSKRACLLADLLRIGLAALAGAGAACAFFLL